LRPWVSTNSYDVEALTALGTAYHFTQDTPNALSMLDLALSMDPDFEDALRQRVLLGHETGDFESAIRHGRRLIELNPHRFDDHARRAHMLGRVGRWSEAIEAARTAAEMRPWNPQIHGWLAEAYRITGQQQLSNRHAERYAKLQAASRTDER
jgi:tetratricopeptide (TPR) repeat protein